MKQRRNIVFSFFVCLTVWQALSAMPVASVYSDDNLQSPVEHASSDCWLQSAQEALPPARITKVLQFSLQCPVCKINTHYLFTVHSVAGNLYFTHTTNSYILAAKTILCSLPKYNIAYLFIAFW